MFKNVSIIGDGAMGTVLAMLLCEKQIAVRMWGYDEAQLEKIASAGENVKFLPGYKLPESLVFDGNDETIFESAELIVSAVPCQFMRGIWNRLKSHLPKDVPIVSVTKGIENETLMRPDEIIADVIGFKIKTAVLSGPTIADELARKLPATACIACEDEALAKGLQQTFSADWFRVYRNVDIPFGFEDYKQLLENSYFLFKGKPAKIIKFTWNFGRDTATVDFWVREPYTFNLEETYLNPA